MRIKKIIGFAAAAVITVLVGMFFRLQLPYVLALTLFILVLLPFFFATISKNRREYQRFVDANAYIEQFLYSFLKTGNIRETLAETASIADEGRLKHTIKKALDNDLPYGDLEYIEKKYPLELIETIHHFAKEVVKNGGAYSNQTLILLETRRLWEARARELLAEKKRQRTNILLSILTSLFLCSLMYVLTDKISVDIADSKLVQWMTMLILMADFVIYLIAEKKLCVGLVRKEELDVKEYRRLEQRIVAYGDRNPLDILAKRAGKKRFKRALEKEFPRWLMQVALLLESGNVQVAILKSYDTAPAILQPELERLINGLRDKPSSIDPYLDFYREYQVPGIGSAMKLLYSMSSGFGGDSATQINEILKQNQGLMDRAERLKNEDRIAGMYGLFLAPQITGGIKLLVDMMVMLSLYLGQMQIGF